MVEIINWMIYAAYYKNKKLKNIDTRISDLDENI